LSHLHKEVHSNKSFPSTDPILTQNPGAPWTNLNPQPGSYIPSKERGSSL
jgi:hypothetical protein